MGKQSIASGQHPLQRGIILLVGSGRAGPGLEPYSARTFPHLRRSQVTAIFHPPLFSLSHVSPANSRVATDISPARPSRRSSNSSFMFAPALTRLYALVAEKRRSNEWPLAVT